MATLETQYKIYIQNNPECDWTFEQWIEYHFDFLKEFVEWDSTLTDGIDDEE